MSDVPQGPGWWVASDGKWYAPELHPDYRPPPPPPPSPSPALSPPPAPAMPVLTPPADWDAPYAKPVPVPAAAQPPSLDPRSASAARSGSARAPGRGADRPWYRSWWLWVGVGVAAVVIAAVVVVTTGTKSSSSAVAVTWCRLALGESRTEVVALMGTPNGTKAASAAQSLGANSRHFAEWDVGDDIFLATFNHGHATNLIAYAGAVGAVGATDITCPPFRYGHA